jgi:DNA-binding GntR family transcriptional regulator
MDLAAMRTFFQTAPMIYASVARMAAEHRTDRQLDDIRAIQRRFRAATETRSAGDAALENHAFHRQIGEMAANPYLLPSFERMLIDHTRLSQTFYRPESPKEEELVRTAVVQHDAMIAAFEARDREAAVELTLRHWELSQDRLERFVRPDPLPLDPAKGLRDAV